MGFDDICNTGLGLGLSLGLGCLVKQENFTHRRKKKKSWMGNDLFCPSLTLGPSDDASKPHADDELIDWHRRASSVTSVSSFLNSAVKKERGFGDEDDEGSHRKKLGLRKRQSAILEDSFKEHSTLNPKKKQALADQLNLRPRQVEVWFQNRRARTKLKQTEVDCEFLKKTCETLTEENKRLHNELQELKSWKQKASYCMQPPAAATLTLCPSCERVANGGEDPSNFKIRTKTHLFNPLSSHPSAACS
ncbi:homeobox-leucine zipper protein HAT22-like isoform X2 [Hibiscus syriacus]|uniref:homeobox-leucine zipper protein HAT22-like isoform X2 n=1 Tax=Hibiscus syriacus TaxID=106335 RepID=UPI001920537D|nr:homeobox-leucine zipper protein HAT22-like isoform X2 [Hibiscus syriacus]